MWTASARAKINLHLAVHARRPDGYHALTTVFQTIALADTLTVVEHDGPLTLRCPGSDAPEDDSNLVVRAARALAAELGRPEPRGRCSTSREKGRATGGDGG
jgi:4-diphosphocytidyl-2-C-methyl-D-erythritol kinase